MYECALKYPVHSFLAKTDKDEACYVSNLVTKLLENGYKHEDVCILYRNNQLSVNIEKELTSKRIPFTLYGSYPFFSHKEIKCLINHYLFLTNRDDLFALSMILNYPRKVLKESTLSKLNTIQINTKESLCQIILKSDDPEVVEASTYLNDLIIKFEELYYLDFFNYLLDKIKILDTFKDEKNAKAKTARVLEFRTFIVDYHLN